MECSRVVEDVNSGLSVTSVELVPQVSDVTGDVEVVLIRLQPPFGVDHERRAQGPTVGWPFTTFAPQAPHRRAAWRSGLHSRSWLT